MVLRIFWRRLHTDPQVDAGRVGVSFVDVLFALVVGYAITPLATWWKISGVGWFDLGVAATLTLTSWIGYHNSANRPQWTITFPNLPLAVFALDIAMVITYAFSVFVAATITPEASPRPAAFPEAAAVGVSFIFYVLWDSVNLAIKRSERYAAAWVRAQERDVVKPWDLFPPDSPGRRQVTWAFAVFALLLAVYARYLDLHVARLSKSSVATLDVVLVVLLLSFRLAKELVPPPPRDSHEPGSNQEPHDDAVHI